MVVSCGRRVLTMFDEPMFMPIFASRREAQDHLSAWMGDHPGVRARVRFDTTELQVLAVQGSAGELKTGYRTRSRSLQAPMGRILGRSARVRSAAV